MVRYGATECVPQNDSQSDEYLGLVQHVPAETNSDITVAEAAELNHKKALDESKCLEAHSTKLLSDRNTAKRTVY